MWDPFPFRFFLLDHQNAASEDGAYNVLTREQESMDRALLGDRKPEFDSSTPLGASLKLALAVHEGGRAVFAADERRRSGIIDDIEKVSLVRRGDSYTRTTYARLQDDSYLLVTRKQLYAQLRLALAGHAAECALGMDPSSYSANDFAVAAVRLLFSMVVGGNCVTLLPPYYWPRLSPAGPTTTAIANLRNRVIA
jgi:hypothetical protein